VTRDQSKSAIQSSNINAKVEAIWLLTLAVYSGISGCTEITVIDHCYSPRSDKGFSKLSYNQTYSKVKVKHRLEILRPVYRLYALVRKYVTTSF